MASVVVYEGSSFGGHDLLMYLETLSPLISVIVVALVIGWIATTWLRIKNGYPLTDAYGKSVHPRKSEDDGRVQQLTQENAQLRADLSRVKERIANVERIVTDSGYSTSAQIEALRDARRTDDDAISSPMSMERKERI